jgi:proline iminopeptidase
MAASCQTAIELPDYTSGSAAAATAAHQAGAPSGTALALTAGSRYRGAVRIRFAIVAAGTGVVLAAMMNIAAAPGVAQALAPRERRVGTGAASLYVRDVGSGPPFIVLHGGPDFDHRYLLPDLDRLADGFRLVYYDQRGRGQSADGFRPDDVTLASEIEDVDRVRRGLQLESAALLGHSWGALLALEYALRHPARVSHLVLMNPAPVSARDFDLLRKSYARKLGDDMGRQLDMLASAAYKDGDPLAVAARYRVHFKPAFTRPESFERLMAAMKEAFVSQGRAGILKARAVEDRLFRETWQSEGYDLLPKLGALKIPTLVIHGEDDFIPADVSVHIADAIPGAHLVRVRGCGHFSYLECPADTRRAIDGLFRRAKPTR